MRNQEIFVIGISLLTGLKAMGLNVKNSISEVNKLMINIRLNEGCSGYNAIGEYVKKYWEHNITSTVICSIGTSYDGSTYSLHKEVATPSSDCDVEFLSDWWEGERYIKLFGIKTVEELDISGGIYV